MELGFVEKIEDPSQLTSSFFPSKIGGKPAWLDPHNLPAPESLSCRRCRTPLVFLLQVYAPLSDGDDSTFHRSIFIFMCKNPTCHHQAEIGCFKVFRCQLPKVNRFYQPSSPTDCVSTEARATDQLQQLNLNQDETPECDKQPSTQVATLFVEDIKTCDGEGVKSKPLSQGTPSVSPPLCIVCGLTGPKSCAKCKKVHYCSKEHQVHDWKNGHKLFCSDLAKDRPCAIDYDPGMGVTLPLFEIVTELEPDASSLESVPERSVEERMAEYRKVAQTRNLSVAEVSKEITREGAAKEKKSDKQFKAFKKRVALEPEQVIRYQRDSSPLLVSNDGVPTGGKIPNCSCGAKRVFELQVMPQLLYYLKLDEVRGPSIDWGTLLLYTCKDSCSTGQAYKEEFVWRQQFSQ